VAPLLAKRCYLVGNLLDMRRLGSHSNPKRFYAAWQVRQVFNDPESPLIEVRLNEGSHAAQLGMWGRSS
jgi:hypothetical protein